MASVKEVIESAHFTVATGVPFEGFICSKGKAKRIKHQTKRNMFFTTQDMLVDAVVRQYRQTPKVNVWRRRLPMEVLEFCYRAVAQDKMSFVLDFTKNENPDRNMDYLVCIFDQRQVNKTPQYTKVYDYAVGR